MRFISKYSILPDSNTNIQQLDMSDNDLDIFILYPYMFKIQNVEEKILGS